MKDRIKARDEFLKTLYDETNASEDKYFNKFELGERLGLSRKDTANILSYLLNERLINSMGWDFVGISHDGIKVVEKGLKFESPHPTNINIHNINSPGAQVGVNSTQTIKTITSPPSIDEIRSFVSTLKEQLLTMGDISVDDKEEVKDDLSLVEKQLNRSDPNVEKVKSRLKSIISSLAEKAAVQAIVSKFPSVAHWLHEHLM